MNDDAWQEIYAKDLAQHHVGRKIRLAWSSGSEATGRLAKLSFEHPTRHFTNGTKELGDRISEVTIELGWQSLTVDLPLMTKVYVESN